MRASEARTWIALLGALVGVVLWQGQWLEDLLGRGPGLAATGLPLAVIAAWLARAEWRHGALRELIDRCCTDPRRAFALTALLLAGAVKVYAVPGFRVLEGDGVSHSTATYLVAQSLRAHEPLGWSNAWALGFPFLQFYPPAFAVVAGGLTTVVGDPLVAVRILLALAHGGSGIGAYLLARRLTDRPGAAIACAVAYAMSPWHLFQVFHWNRFPAALTWALLPFVLWLWERGLAGRRWRAAMAVLLAGAALAHHGYALFVAIFLVLWVAVRVAGRTGERRARLLELVAVGAAAFGLSAPFVAGYVLESGLTFRPPGLEGARFAFDQPTLASVLVPARRPVGHSGYIGLSLFVLGLGGLLHGLLRGGPGRRAAFVGFAYAWVLALGSSLFLYDWLPFARALFYGGRYLIFLVLFLALGVAFAWQALEERLREGGRWPLVALALLGVLLLDLGGTTFTRYRHPFPGGADREAAYRALGDPLRPRLDRRVLELPADPRGFLHTALLPLASGRGTPAPGLWGTLPSVTYSFRSWVDVTRAYEAQGRLGEPELERLALLGLDEVIAPESWSADGASPTALPHPGDRVRIELGRRGFVLAAREWVPMRDDLELPTAGWQLAPFDNDSDPPGAVGRLLDTMDIDLEHGTARRFVLRHPSRFESRLAERHDPPPGTAHAGAAEGPRLVVESLEVTPSSVRLAARVDEPCLLRIAQSHYRHQIARVDGERVPSWPDAAHATVLAVSAGTHSIELLARPSPLRRALLVAGWAWAAALALLPTALRRRRSRS